MSDYDNSPHPYPFGRGSFDGTYFKNAKSFKKKDGTKGIRFGLGVRSLRFGDSEPNSTFINCVVFHPRKARNLAQSLKRGVRLHVEGPLYIEEYEGRESIQMIVESASVSTDFAPAISKDDGKGSKKSRSSRSDDDNDFFDDDDEKPKSSKKSSKNDDDDFDFLDDDEDEKKGSSNGGADDDDDDLDFFDDDFDLNDL